MIEKVNTLNQIRLQHRIILYDRDPPFFFMVAVMYTGGIFESVIHLGKLLKKALEKHKD
jgi:hypothetical protein